MMSKHPAKMPTRTFEPDEHRELRKCLGSKADAIMPGLQALVADFPQVKAKLLRSDAFREWQDDLRPLQSATKGLRAAQRELDAYGPDHQPAGRADLDRAEAEFAAQIERTERLFGFLYPSRRHRHKDEARRWLSNLVGSILRLHGIRLYKTHNALDPFQFVLQRVIEAAERLATGSGERPKKVPDDLYDYIADTIDALDGLAPETLAKLGVVVGLLRNDRRITSAQLREYIDIEVP